MPATRLNTIMIWIHDKIAYNVYVKQLVVVIMLILSGTVG